MNLSTPLILGLGFIPVGVADHFWDYKYKFRSHLKGSASGINFQRLTGAGARQGSSLPSKALTCWAMPGQPQAFKPSRVASIMGFPWAQYGPHEGYYNIHAYDRPQGAMTLGKSGLGGIKGALQLTADEMELLMGGLGGADFPPLTGGRENIFSSTPKVQDQPISKSQKSASEKAASLAITQHIPAIKQDHEVNLDENMPQNVQMDPSVDAPRLYCLCRQPDENEDRFMIGCDKCDEWYHPACVGLDMTLIQDIETYDFTCPPCKAMQVKKGQKSHKKGQNAQATAKPQENAANKRTVKAGTKQESAKDLSKGDQMSDEKSIKESNQIVINSQAGLGKKKPTTSSTQAIPSKPIPSKGQPSTNTESKSTLLVKRTANQVEAVTKSDGNKIVLTGKPAAAKNNGQQIKQKREETKVGDQKSDIEGDNTQNNEQSVSESASGVLPKKSTAQPNDSSRASGQMQPKVQKIGTAQLPQKLFEEAAVKPKQDVAKTPAQLPENNVEKVVQMDGRLYFVNRHLSKDLPLQQHFSMAIPDRRLVINEDHIPNLRQLLFLRAPMNSLSDSLNLVEEAKQILIEKLRRNLMMSMPVVAHNKDSANSQ